MTTSAKLNGVFTKKFHIYESTIENLEAMHTNEKAYLLRRLNWIAKVKEINRFVLIFFVQVAHSKLQNEMQFCEY